MFVTKNLPAVSILFWLNVEGYEGQSLQNRFIFVCLFPQKQRGHKKKSIKYICIFNLLADLFLPKYQCRP